MAGVDTSFFIDLLRGLPEAVALYKDQKTPLFVSELVVFEFLCGKITKDEEADFLGELQECTFVTFERQEALFSAHIFRELKRKGKTRPLLDTAIAGSYLASHVTTILTRNGKDFEDIPGLKVETY